MVAETRVVIVTVIVALTDAVPRPGDECIAAASEFQTFGKLLAVTLWRPDSSNRRTHWSQLASLEVEVSDQAAGGLMPGGRSARFQLMDRHDIRTLIAAGLSVSRKSALGGPNSRVEQGLTIWLTGLSGAGKTSIAGELARQLNGHSRVEVLDADMVRTHICKGLGFSEEDRRENVRRLAWLARTLAETGAIVLVSAISPYRNSRREARDLIGRFLEVYVNAPLSICEGRDVKGLYKRARRGEIRSFTGIDDPYEPPFEAEVECRTDLETINESVAKILAVAREIEYGEKSSVSSSERPVMELNREPRRTARTDIAVVGGGCSGTLVAVQLWRQGFRGSVAIVEPRRELGRGLAYSTQFSGHLLNVPAGRMSALPDQPAHFLDWLRFHGCPEVAPGVFATRKKYGEYLEDLFQTEMRSSAQARDTGHICAEAVAIKAGHNFARVLLNDGTHIEADKVVLALGNPASSPTANVAVTGVDKWTDGSPWHDGALILRFPGERILLLGTGLTAVDAMLALLAQGGDARISMISRRGLLPRTHAACQPAPEFDEQPPASSLLGELRELRALVAAMKTLGLCWRPAVDSLRPMSNEIWQRLPLSDRRRFLRHLKPYWEPHRHRMAPEIAAQVEAYRADGRLTVIAGRVVRVAHESDSIQVRIASNGVPHRMGDSVAERLLEVDRVINCTGIQENYNDSRRPLIRSIIADGIASANDLGLGFRTGTHSALVEADGKTSRTLFTLGPTRRGELFETTALAEIRTQAEALARHLIET